MKNYFILFALIISLHSGAQNQDGIDSRFLVNKELSAKAQENFLNNKEEYNFMLFELNNGYFLKAKSEITESQKSQMLTIDGIVDSEGKAFDPAVLSNPTLFNFYAYNFQRSATKTVGYDLGNGMVLVFYSTEKLRAMYNQQKTTN